MPNSSYEKGLEAFSKRDYPNAQNQFLLAVNDKECPHEAYFYLGHCQYYGAEWQAAISNLKTFIKLRQFDSQSVKNISNAFDLLGQCYEKINDVSNVWISYTTAVKTNKDNPSPWHNMGLLCMKTAREKPAETLSYLNKAYTFLQSALVLLKDNPSFIHSFASWWEQYAETFQEFCAKQCEHYDSAIRYYLEAKNACKVGDEALKNIIQDNLAECYAQYGHLFYQNQEYKQAEEKYIKVLELDPNHITVINQRGMIFLKQENYLEARKYFEDILKKIPSLEQTADAYLNIAVTYRLEKLLDKAKAALTEAKKLVPNDDAIAEEETKLKEMIGNAALISAPQVLLATKSTDEENKPALATTNCGI